ncbi:McrB family protein [Citrobacter braakii]|uniref:McrB family protein n=1 Tax=Citrobacter braakii TaxID=57706 RepID=UPI0039B505F6
MTWSTANHEVIPEQEFLLPDSTMHPYLWAFLQSDGEPFKESSNDYEAVRRNLATAISKFHGRPVKGRAPTEDVKASRLRTWKPLFERAGLLTVNKDGTLHVSPFGRAVKDLFDDLANRISGANEHLSQWAITVLGRYPLLNPLENMGSKDSSYPDDSDLLPFRAIWQAARQLGNQLHWQELNRGLMLIHYQRDVDAVIDRIRKARAAGGDDYFKDPVPWLGTDVAVDDGGQTRRRVTPWLSRASFGGLLAEEDEETGLWVLRLDRLALIDEALRENVVIPNDVRVDRANFVRWLSEPISRSSPRSTDPEDLALLKKAVDSANKFGHSKIVCFSGMPGTGKSRLTKLVADELTDGDPYRSVEIQFHESIAYEDFVEGFVPRPDGTGFRLVDKTLRMICRRAASDPSGKHYVLVIEEFTRANVHAVLGELLTYIEHRGRRFRYAISQEEAAIPPNLIIIATMNPRDRSATQLDAAVRRRLHYVDVPPSVRALESMLKHTVSPNILTSLVEWYTKWYTRLPFGHGVFSEVTDDESISSVWTGTCLRLLENALGEIDENYTEAVEDFPCKLSSASA